MTNDDKKYYWLAIRGYGVPATNIPLTIEQAKRAGVIVASKPGGATFWLVSRDDLSWQSNYDLLVGFPTKWRRDKSQRRLVTGFVSSMQTEIARIKREEVVITAMNYKNKAVVPNSDFGHEKGECEDGVS